jgi:hypothetical protein
VRGKRKKRRKSHTHHLDYDFCDLNDFEEEAREES